MHVQFVVYINSILALQSMVSNVVCGGLHCASKFRLCEDVVLCMYTFLII